MNDLEKIALLKKANADMLKNTQKEIEERQKKGKKVFDSALKSIDDLINGVEKEPQQIDTKGLLFKKSLMYEPLRKNRWILRFPSDLGIQEWWVEKCTHDMVKEELKITLRHVSPSVTQIIYHLVKNFNTYTNLEISIEFLDPTGVCVEKHIFSKCELIYVQPMKLDYLDNDILTTEITIKYNELNFV